MTNSSIDVGNYILQQKLEEKKTLNRGNDYVTIMELIKLIYISHGYHLAFGIGSLVANDRIEVWPLGPVVVEAYKKFRFTDGGIYIKKPLNDCIELDDNAKQTIDKVIDAYKDLDPFVLSERTHLDGSPWTQVLEDKGMYAIIEDSIIKKYYMNFIKK